MDKDPEKYIADQSVDLGPCCICETEDERVRNILNLNFRAPIAGTGWGCYICHLKMDGAIAVLCDDCMGGLMAGEIELKFLVSGYPGKKGRIPYEGFKQIPFNHREKYHDHERRKENYQWN